MKPYVVRRLRPAAFAPLLAIPVLIAFTALTDLPGFPAVFLIAFAAFSAYVGWQRSVVLRVAPDGIQLGRGVEYAYGRQQLAGAKVPWTSVREVALLADAEVGVRLREGAPMPAGVRSIIHDPADPDAVPAPLRVRVPELDRQRLEQAVRAFGPDARVTYG